MAISPVSKFNLVSLKRNKKEIIELLHNFGVAQIEDWLDKENIEKTNEISAEYLHAQVTFAINFLAKYDTTKISLADKFLSGKIELTNQELTNIVQDFDYKKIVNECENYEARLNELHNIIERNNNDKKLLSFWLGLNFIPQNKLETDKTTTILGSVNLVVYEELLRQSEKLKNVNLQKSSEANREIFFAITYFNNLESQVHEMLTHFDFKPAQLPEITCLSNQKAKEYEQSIQEAHQEIKEIITKVNKLTTHLKKLKIISDYLVWQKEQETALDKSKQTIKTFSLLFWMENCFIDEFKKELTKITDNFSVDKIAVKDNETTPIILRNKSIVEPFEAVTGVYGMPLKNEVDPTPFLAPFFFIFFGFCVSDAGYGIVITILMALMYKFIKKPAAEKKLIKLLIFGGLATLIIGAMFGSWFGIDVAVMPDGHWLKSFILAFKVIDPVKDPITVLIVSLIFGIIQIMAGLIINVYWKIKTKQAIEGLLGSGLWFLLLLTLCFWIMTKVNVLPTSLNTVITYALLIVAMGIVLASGRKTKNVFLKLPIGLYSLYNVIGYLSDTLSYSRLLALGLATGIIAMVINLIAGLAIDMLPFVGYILAGVILIGGHLFNIGINALGAFIHSGRLQFVEFFPKFMEGGGVRFKPFRKETNYIRVLNKL